ncbi:hypothetical protein ACFV2X_54595 [Streptomyces sp. NPDC059679]|uniref:hypothetical protein n=1 Tax=Streptomyces sp. NPDC059679 TaxID=3346903 RepID=UPI00369C6FE9
MFDLTRKELAALNNTVTLLKADAEASGRTITDEVESRTAAELAALFIGSQVADMEGHHGEERHAAAREHAAAALEGRQIDPGAAVNFRAVLCRWIG